MNIPFTKDNFHDALVEAKMFYGVYVYNIPMNQKPIESFGLNFYTPYLNKKVIEFINSLPEEWINGGNTFQKLTNYAVRRKFHKMALLRYLPKRYVYGLQQSFDVPWHVLFNKRPGILNKLLVRLKKRGWYNNKELEKLFKEFPRQKAKPHEILELKHHGYRIYSLLVFEVWCMEFLDNIKTKKKNISLEDYLSIKEAIN
jgi:asparagine synthase (glutamine-hydrolysing)